MSQKLPKREMVKISKLKNADYNPENRTAPKNTKRLSDSLDLLGMLAPVVCTPDYRVIDGHRRLATAKRLGWDEVECVIVDLDPHLVYASINVTSRPMSGNDALCVWIKCPFAVPKKLHGTFETMSFILGEERVKKMAHAGLSACTFNIAKRIARYCGKADAALVCKIVDWLMLFPISGQVTRAISAGVSADIILKAIKAGKPVKLSLAVDGSEDE